MGFRNKILCFLICSSIFGFQAFSQDLKINELMSSNRGLLFDEDDDTPDWIEICNYGEAAVNLGEYFLSDNSADLLKWQFPEMKLGPNQPLLVFASGKNRLVVPFFWYTLIDKGDVWQYIIPKEEPPSNWKSAGFEAQSWRNGRSGIGYGDSDDATITPINTLSVFMRKTVEVTEIDLLKSLWLHIDFDDAFVAYLNGTEVARQGIGQAGEAVPFDKKADVSHEAQIIKGEAPDEFDLSEFIHLLKEGENVLAVQVHNVNLSSSDLTAIPIFTAGYSHEIESDKTVSSFIRLSNKRSHTNFKLSSSGETVSLTHQNGGVADSVNYGQIPGNFSYGRSAGATEKWGYFSEPSPGLPNSSVVFTGVVANEVQFSVKEMFLTGAQNLTLTGAGQGEEVRYTLDGTEPKTTSTVYENPIAITETSVVRARIFKTGFVPGTIRSRTYLFDNPPTIPVISVVTDPKNLWDTDTGIYILGENAEVEKPHKGANYWEDWEKAANIEMVETNGELQFSLNCGIKIFGGWSRMQIQKSLAVFFRNEYGDPELKGIQLFESNPVTKFKSLVLRNSGNDFGFSKMRDGMMTSLVRNLDIDLASYQPTILYLNGDYWGIINLREKINEDFLESHHDVNSDAVDLLVWNGAAVEGTSDSYWELIAYLENNDVSDSSVYKILENEIDIGNFIDYQLSEIYFDNRDWPGNNSKYWRSQTDEGKWRWLMYDTDFGFGIYNAQAYSRNTLDFALETDGPPWPNPPWSTFLFRKLMENETFRNRFINRFADVLNTTFLPENVIAHIDSLYKAIEPEIVPNYEKWKVPSVNVWNANIQRMILFASKRPGYMRTFIKEQFSIPEHNKVKISILPSGSGTVDLNSITISTSEWEGEYFEDVPVSLGAKAVAGYQFYGWMVDGVLVTEGEIELNISKSTSIRALFEEEANDGNSVVFNEINYNSPDNGDAGDWVEIYNWGRFDLDLSGWVFKDDNDSHEFVIPENRVLKSGEYLILCRDEEKFTALHGGVKNFIGEFGFGLSGSGDAVRLFDSYGQLVDEVVFRGETPWPEEPNGGGVTLELRQYFNENSEAEFWKPSLVNFGTPGAENSVTTGSGRFASVVQKKELKVYPNPFTVETRIRIDSNGLDPVSIRIFSLDGRMVCNETSTNNEFIWRGENSAGQKLQPGIYICKVQSGGELFSAKIILNQ